MSSLQYSGTQLIILDTWQASLENASCQKPWRRQPHLTQLIDPQCCPRPPIKSQLHIYWSHPGYIDVLVAMTTTLTNQQLETIGNFLQRVWMQLRKRGKRRPMHQYIHLEVINSGPLYTNHMPCISSCINWQSKLQPLIKARAILTANTLWLSTLGGAYSALGETNRNHDAYLQAIRAGELALSQRRLAIWMGHEVLAMQCLLFTSYALMQLDCLKSARDVILRVWKYARSTPNVKLRESTQNAWQQLRVQRAKKKRTRDLIHHLDSDSAIKMRIS